MKDITGDLLGMPFIVGEMRDPNKAYSFLSFMRSQYYRSTLHATTTAPSHFIENKETLGGHES